jgi:beta-glucosidase
MPDFVVPPGEAIQSFVGDAATVTLSLTDNTGDGASAARGKDAAIVFVNA